LKGFLNDLSPVIRYGAFLPGFGIGSFPGLSFIGEVIPESLAQGLAGKLRAMVFSCRKPPQGASDVLGLDVKSIVYLAAFRHDCRHVTRRNGTDTSFAEKSGFDNTILMDSQKKLHPVAAGPGDFCITLGFFDSSPMGRLNPVTDHLVGIIVPLFFL
jgi:hypothetical protein